MKNLFGILAVLLFLTGCAATGVQEVGPMVAAEGAKAEAVTSKQKAFEDRTELQMDVLLRRMEKEKLIKNERGEVGSRDDR